MRVAPLFAFGLLLACSSKSTPVEPTDAEGEVDDESGVPTCDLAVSKGPWVVAASATTAKVRWESCRSGGGALFLSPEAGGGKQRFDSTVRDTQVTTTNDVPLRMTADWAGTYFMHEVALTGLTEGTCYSYELEPDSTAKGRFCTARAAGATFKFATLGDTNPGFGDITVLQDKTYTTEVPDFTIHQGDIQYYSSGLESYGYWMEKMRPMLRTGAFFPSIGNHESEKPNERTEYVERFWGNPGFDGNSDYYRFQWGGVWFFALNTEIAMDDKSPQGLWLQEKLADATTQPGYRFSVIFMHRPFVTCGDMDENDALRARYMPLFTKSNVKLVVAGHMHGYERFEMDDVTWLTSAGGGSLLGDVDKNITRAECVNRKSSGKFWNASVITVKPGEIDGVTYDDKGTLRDTFSRLVP